MRAFPLLAAPHFSELSPRWSAIPDVYMDNAARMLALAETARAAGGGVPVQVSSWYRSPLHNTIAGGAGTSQHLTASAMDLVPSGDIATWFDHVRATLPADSFGQLIFERSHVHLSLPNRANGRTGEILTEPTEGTYQPLPGVAQQDDTREGYANPTTLAAVVVVAIIFYALLSGGR